ncbi:MAG: hypothetical protein GXO78_06895 [Calditrichaeota bacterium]|nr:hypothetical protein [Calditrichota bacterium]
MKNFWILLLAAIVFTGFYLIGSLLPTEIISSLDRAGIILGYLLSCLSIGAVIVVYFNRFRIKRWFLKNNYDNIGEKFHIPAEDIEAMVIPVSRREQPEWILRWLKPQKVSLLYSQKTLPDAREIMETFDKQVEFFPPKDSLQNNEYILHNPFDPHDSYTLTKQYIRRFLEIGIPPNKIFVDATGGTVPMSIGCFQAGEEMGVSSIYVIGTDNGFITNPTKKEHGIPIFLSDKTGVPQ